MKVRHDFVTNSSSSSFVVMKKRSEKDMLVENVTAAAKSFIENSKYQSYPEFKAVENGVSLSYTIHERLDNEKMKCYRGEMLITPYSNPDIIYNQIKTDLQRIFTKTSDDILRKGDIVYYVGGKYYSDSYGGGKCGELLFPGDIVQITHVNETGDKPYHLSGILTEQITDYGWVDRAQIELYGGRKIAWH